MLGDSSIRFSFQTQLGISEQNAQSVPVSVKMVASLINEPFPSLVYLFWNC